MLNGSPLLSDVVHPVGLPSEFDVGLQGAGAFSSDMPSFPNGCHIRELEIDHETGEVTLDRYTVSTIAGP